MFNFPFCIHQSITDELWKCNGDCARVDICLQFKTKYNNNIKQIQTSIHFQLSVIRIAPNHNIHYLMAFLRVRPYNIAEKNPTVPRNEQALGDSGVNKTPF